MTCMLAVIRTGGKQYLASPKQKIKIEKLLKNEGDEVVFEEVLLIEDNGNVQIGFPTIKGATVKARVLKQGKGEKIIVFQYKTKKDEKKKKGHRQPYTEVEIISVDAK